MQGRDSALHSQPPDLRVGSPGFGAGCGGWPRRRDCGHGWNPCPGLEAGAPEQGRCERVCIFRIHSDATWRWRPGQGKASSGKSSPGPCGGLPKRPMGCSATPASPLLPQRMEGRSLNASLVLLSCRLKALAATGRKTVEEASNW